MDKLVITRPDDWHLHLRDDALLASVLPYTCARFSRAVVMPNLDPPITTVAQAAKYRQRILAARPAGSSFTPLMTLYLTDDKSHIVAMARRNGEILWQQDALHRRMLTTTAVYGAFLVAGDFEGYLHWFKRSDGKLAARNKVGGGRINATPLVLDDLVFVQSDGGRLSAYRAKLPVAED